MLRISYGGGHLLWRTWSAPRGCTWTMSSSTRVRRRSTNWTRIRINLRNVPEGERPPEDPPEPDYDPWPAAPSIEKGPLSPAALDRVADIQRGFVGEPR